MRKEFRKFDKNHVRVVDMKVITFNDLIKEIGVYIKTKTEELNDCIKRTRDGRPELSEEKCLEYAQMTVDSLSCSTYLNSNEHIPASHIISDYLGVNVVDYYWIRDGEYVEIVYTV